MKIYQYTNEMKLYVIKLIIGLDTFPIVLLSLHGPTPMNILVISWSWLTLSVLVVLNTFIVRLVVDEEKIEKRNDIRNLKSNRVIYWKDVTKVFCYTKLSRYNMILDILDEKKGRYKGVAVDIAHYPLELLNEILSRVPVSTIVELDPWLKEQYIKEFGDGIFKRFLFTQ